jgi:hypothetical protein
MQVLFWKKSVPKPLFYVYDKGEDGEVEVFVRFAQRILRRLERVECSLKKGI